MLSFSKYLTRSLLGGFFIFSCIVCNGSDFFGIPVLGEPKDQLKQTIYFLKNGETRKAKESFDRLKESAPNTFKNFSLTNFSIPCPDYSDKNSLCELCDGRQNYFDKYALHYFGYKFEQIWFDEAKKNKNFDLAFAEAYKCFSRKKELVLSREIFQGQIYQKYDNFFIIKDINDNFFRLFGTVYSSAAEGDPYIGYYWRVKNKNFDFKNDKGSVESIPSFTLTLWRDY